MSENGGTFVELPVIIKQEDENTKLKRGLDIDVTEKDITYTTSIVNKSFRFRDIKEFMGNEEDSNTSFVGVYATPEKEWYHINYPYEVLRSIINQSDAIIIGITRKDSVKTLKNLD